MLEPILSQILTARQRGAGLELSEDGRILTLRRKEEVYARWYVNKYAPTCTDIQERADRVLEEDEQLFSFVMEETPKK